MKSLSLLFLLCWGGMLSAQQYLYIQKAGNTPAERLEPFERVKVKFYSEDDWITGTITGITVEHLSIGRRSFALSDIEKLRTYRSLMRLGGTALWAGGIFFTGIAAFNGVINGDDPIIYPSQLKLGAILTASGLLVNLLSRKTYAAGEYQFKVIDFRELHE